MRAVRGERRTSAVELLVVGFRALSADEQEEAFLRLVDARLERLASEGDEFARHLSSLQRVAELTAGDVTPATYRAARRELVAAGEEVVELNTLIRYFGSWRRAKEALGLSEVATARKIEARFRGRLIGKVHVYREETLKEVLLRCVSALGVKAPLVVEFEHWRYRELELAKAEGRELFLPSASPYRRRFGTWEKALEALLELSTEEAAARLEPGRARTNEAVRASVRRG